MFKKINKLYKIKNIYTHLGGEKVLFKLNFYQEDNIHTLKAGGGMVKIERLRKKSVFVVSCFVTNTINLEALKQLTFIMAQFFHGSGDQHGSTGFSPQGLSLKVLARSGLIFLWESSFRLRQNSVPRKCKTEVPCSLLAASLRPLSAPRGCSQFLANGLTHLRLTRHGGNRILQGQQQNVPRVKSPSERAPFF